MKKLLAALMKALERRATLRELAHLDERTLRDIGLDRGADRTQMDAVRRRMTFGLY